MGIVIGLIGFICFFVYLIWFILSLIKRDSKKKPIIGMVVCFTMFAVGVAMTPTEKKTNSAEDGAPQTSQESEISNIPQAAQNESESTEPILTQTEVDPITIKGRGWSDSGRSEPQYVGMQGYVVIDYMDTRIRKTEEYQNTPWMIPIYEKDKQFYVECGYIEHKTEVVVKSQELKHEGYGAYSGYLVVERIDNREELCIDVGNFLTNPYWKSENKIDAAACGYYIAEFKQVSDYYPVTKSGGKVELPDGFTVLVTGKTGLYGRGGPDYSTNQIEAVVFTEWTNGYGGVTVYFNGEDLTIVY